MKFGKVPNPGDIDFTLPEDHPKTEEVFRTKGIQDGKPKIYIGCAKWNKQDLKNFYPRGTKDELAYYSTQFNCIELNATFYRIFPPEQFAKWRDKTPDSFKFFPKIPQEISHFKQLNNFQEATDRYLASATELGDKLGTIFLQMHERFAPDRFDRLQHFVNDWPADLPLTVELRHTSWYDTPAITEELCDFLEERGVAFTLVDTAGRRDMLHMRMTTPRPFVRWVGANHESDYTRLDDWVNRIETWTAQGMEELQFFVHQNMELESPLLSAHLIQKLNDRMGWDIQGPETPGGTPTLF